jgi:hypothetical protein
VTGFCIESYLDCPKHYRLKGSVDIQGSTLSENENERAPYSQLLLRFLDLNAPFIITIIWWIIPVVEFFAGISDSIVFGFVYSLSLVFFGVQIGDWGSILTGGIALGALITGFIIRNFFD